MERLTKRDRGGNAVVDCDVCEMGESRLANCGVLKCRNRLKDHLAYYEDAEEQGRLIVLPCIVGDVMYYIYGGYYKPKELCTVSRPCKVKEISIKIVKGKMNYGFILDNGSRYSFSSIGKTVFLSREEAEKALVGEVSK